MNEDKLSIIVNGIYAELVGYGLAMLEADNIPYEERLVRVRELLDDMENAVIAASLQVSSPEETIEVQDKECVMKTNRRYESYIEFSELVGKTFVKINRDDDNDDGIEFVTDKGVTYVQYHEQDCCEHVYVEDINGNLDELLNSPIVKAEETSNSGQNGYESYTWTFYHIVAANGATVTIRWNGESNGYYSESVNMRKHWDECVCINE